jgi:hypothetical protein
LRQGDVLSGNSTLTRWGIDELKGRLSSRPFLFEQFLRQSGSLRIHKTKLMEPLRSRNIGHPASLSARASKTREEIFHD